jgi:hypothetical protein
VMVVGKSRFHEMSKVSSCSASPQRTRRYHVRKPVLTQGDDDEEYDLLRFNACTLETARSFVRTCLLHLQGRRFNEARNHRNQSVSQFLRPRRWGSDMFLRNLGLSPTYPAFPSDTEVCAVVMCPNVTPLAVNMQASKLFLVDLCVFNLILLVVVNISKFHN